MECFKLNNETIDIISEKVGELYESAGSTKKEVFRAKLMIEEALLKYQHHFSEDIEVYFRSYRMFGQMRFCVRIKSPSFDPFTLEENPMAFMLQSIMSNFETGVPTWKYRNLENEIMFSLRKKKNMGSLAKILISLFAAIVLGVAARLIFPQKSLISFVGNYVDPLSDAYAGMFCVMAVLLTFFALAVSIIHIGDMASVGALGGKIMRRFFAVSAIVAVCATVCVLPFFKIGGIGKLNVAAKSIYDILVGFIPGNIVKPFLDFNSVHIMIIGIMFGFSLLAMGAKGETLSKTFEECNLVAVYTNNFLNKFIFLYVGFKAFAIITTSNFTKLAGAGKMVAVIVAFQLVLVVIYTVRTILKTKMPFLKFIKTVMPAFVVCVSSANFGAAFNTIFDDLFSVDVDTSTANLSVNLGSVFFQPACTLTFVFSSLFMATEYGVEITAVWVIMAILLSVVLVGTMPNIPGASVTVITLLYAQLGLPAEAVSLMIAINAILQFFTTGIDVWCLQSEILCIDCSQKIIDKV